VELLGKEVQAKARALRALERALGEVAVRDAEPEPGAKKAKGKVTRTKGVKAAEAVADNALERCRLLALRLSQATLDAANWQQEARDLAAQLEARSSPPPHAPPHAPPASASASFQAPARRPATPSHGNDADAGGADTSGSSDGSDGSDGGSPLSVGDVDKGAPVSSELHAAMSTLAAQVTQIRAAFAPAASAGTRDAPVAQVRVPLLMRTLHAPVTIFLCHCQASLAGRCDELREAAEHCAEQAAAAEQRLALSNRECHELAAEKRRLLERVSHLQLQLLDVKRAANDRSSVAAAVDAAAAAAAATAATVVSGDDRSAVHVSQRALVRLDHLLARALGTSAPADAATDDEDEAISFTRLAGRVSELEAAHGAAIARAEAAEATVAELRDECDGAGQQARATAGQLAAARAELEGMRAHHTSAVAFAEGCGSELADLQRALALAHDSCDDDECDNGAPRVGAGGARASAEALRRALALALAERDDALADAARARRDCARYTGLQRDGAAEGSGAPRPPLGIHPAPHPAAMPPDPPRAAEGGGAASVDELLAAREALHRERSAQWRGVASLREDHARQVAALEQRRADAERETAAAREALAAAQFSAAEGAARPEHLTELTAAEERRRAEARAREAAEAAAARLQVEAAEERLERRRAEAAAAAAAEATEEARAEAQRSAAAGEHAERSAREAWQRAEESNGRAAQCEGALAEATQALVREQAVHAEQMGLLRQQFLRYRSAQQDVTKGLEQAARDLRQQLLARPDRAKQPWQPPLARAASGSARSAQPRGRADGDGAGVAEATAHGLAAALAASEAEAGALRMQLHSLQFERDSRAAEAAALTKVLKASKAPEGGSGVAADAAKWRHRERAAEARETLTEVRLEVAAKEAAALSLALEKQLSDAAALRAAHGAAQAELAALRQQKQGPRVQALLAHVARLKAQLSEAAAPTGGERAAKAETELLACRAALTGAREEASRKGRLLAAAKAGRAADEAERAACAARAAEAEEKLRRCTAELARRKERIEDLQRRAGEAEKRPASEDEATVAGALKEAVRSGAAERARLKQQVTALRAKGDGLEARLRDTEAALAADAGAGEKLAALRATAGQREAALKACRAKLQGARG